MSLTNDDLNTLQTMMETLLHRELTPMKEDKIGRASCRERV